MSIISEAIVATDRPARYGKQLASHFSAKVETGWDGVRGYIEFVGAGKDSEDPRRAFDGKGLVKLEALEDALRIRIYSPKELLGRFEGVIARHLVRFGSKEELVCEWHRIEDPDNS
ncbi:MAG: DUF2218 domain-containing protein [Corynebacterium sp.]|nr:DUF2218 domain-containing protein [Corynebacterium sp.]